MCVGVGVRRRAGDAVCEPIDAVGEQVAGGAQRAELRARATPPSAGELAPVADDLRAGLGGGQREQRGRSSAPAMSGPDSSCSRPTPSAARVLAGGPLQRLGAAPGVIDSRATRRTTWWASRVRCPDSRPAGLGRAPRARRRAAPRRPRPSARRSGRGRPTPPYDARSSSWRVGGRCSGQVVSSQPWPSTTPPRAGAAGGLDPPQAVGQAGRAGEVEPGQGQPGRGGVHVGVDERRGDQRAGEVDHLVGRRAATGWRVVADPGDRAAATSSAVAAGWSGRAARR